MHLQFLSRMRRLINRKPLIGNDSKVIIDIIGIRRGERGETLGKDG